MIQNIIIVFWLHFIGDFLLQTTYMAMNKSKSQLALLFHCSVYSLPLFFFGWRFAIVSGLFHFAIDMYSSKLTSYFYDEKKYRWFFIIIGLDQATHMTILISTLAFLKLI